MKVSRFVFVSIGILGLCLILFLLHTNLPVRVKIKGAVQTFKTAPIIQNGRTLVAAQDIFNALNLAYEYDEQTKELTAKTDDYNIMLTVDAEEASGTRITYTLDVPAQDIDGTLMVPLRFVAEQLGYKVDWINVTKVVKIEDYHLFSEEPDSEAKKAALARARQLTEFTFTPLKDIPTVISGGKAGVFEAGKEYKGFPYSSTEENDKFLCENVSFETFLSALSNPDSVLYTKNMYHSSNASTYYGIVCNSFVRYCLGIEPRCNTARWLEIPGMNVVYAAQEFTVEDMELCDVLHAYGQGSNHVAMITDILRDKTGEIVKVEVSEAVRSTCRRRIFTIEDFFARFGEKYQLCRYEYLDSIPPFDEETDNILKSGIEKGSPAIAVNYGDKSNYLEGDETVISVFDEGENTVQIIRDNQIIEEIPTNGYAKLVRKLEKGYYIVKLVNTDHFTEFCVCKPEITHTVDKGIVTINASSQDPQSKIIHMEFRSEGAAVAGLHTMIELTEEEKQSGVITRKIPEGAANYKISFKNKYGIWTHSMIRI